MKRSHSFDDADVKLKSTCYDGDVELSGDYDHVDINDDVRVEKVRTTFYSVRFHSILYCLVCFRIEYKNMARKKVEKVMSCKNLEIHNSLC